MATGNVKARCTLCQDEDETYECKGCLNVFCFNHLQDHRQMINNQFNQIEDDYNLFRQVFIHRKEDDPNNKLLLQQIDQWEEDSINKIKQNAEQCRQKLSTYRNAKFLEMENKLNNLNDQLKDIRKKNKFNEIHLNQLMDKLNNLRKILETSPNISTEQQSLSFINKILVIVPFSEDTKWKQFGVTVAGGNGDGKQLNQLSEPCSAFIDDDQTMYIADFKNHRIVKWTFGGRNGQIVVGEKALGDQAYKLNGPRNVVFDKENNSLIISEQGNRRVIRASLQNTANSSIINSDIDCSRLTVDKKGSLYISDRVKNEVSRWDKGQKNRILVAGGNGKGDKQNQLDYPTFIFVDDEYSLYISDLNNHRVMKWEKDAKEGIVVAGGNGKGHNLTQLSDPAEVFVDRLGHIYVADWGNHRIMRWCKGAIEGTIIVGGNGQGQEPNQLNHPTGLLFDRQGNLYVIDCGNHRIQKFEIDYNGIN